MKHVIYHEMGNPADVLKLEESAVQALNAGEARADVLASPINPSDLLKIAGLYGVKPDLPETPGGEGIGRITEVTEGVSHLAVGQLVLIAAPVGKWRQSITAPAMAFIPLPDGGDIQQLSMLAVNPMTALLMLQDFVDLEPGDWVVQSAANSAVGSYLIQLAKQMGIRTVNVVRRESLRNDILALGGDAVVVAGDTLTDDIKAATDGAPIKLAIDAVAGDTFTALAQALDFGGTIVSYGAMSMTPPQLPSTTVIFNDVRVRGFWLAKWYETASQEAKQAAFGTLIPAIMSGALKTKIAKTFTLDDIKSAVTLAGQGERDGKVLLLPNG